MAAAKLYGDAIKELAKLAQKGHPIDGFEASGYQKNPMCGDDVTVYAKDADGILEVGYTARGCLISLAACERMRQLVDGKMSRKEARDLVEQVERMFGEKAPGQMEEFAVVRDHRSRHECVKLPFKALSRLLQGE